MSRLGRALAVVPLLLAVGCASQSMHVVSTGTFQQRQTTLVLGSIDFDPPHAYSGDLREVRRLCHGIAKMHGFTIVDQGAPGGDSAVEPGDAALLEGPEGSGLPVIHFYLRDRTYTRELVTLHSVAVFSEIAGPSGASLYKTYYLQDGPDSLQSLRFLMRTLETTFEALAARMQSEDRALQKRAQRKEKLEGP